MSAKSQKTLAKENKTQLNPTTHPTLQHQITLPPNTWNKEAIKTTNYPTPISPTLTLQKITSKKQHLMGITQPATLGYKEIASPITPILGKCSTENPNLSATRWKVGLVSVIKCLTKTILIQLKTLKTINKMFKPVSIHQPSLLVIQTRA